MQHVRNRVSFQQSYSNALKDWTFWLGLVLEDGLEGQYNPMHGSRLELWLLSMPYHGCLSRNLDYRQKWTPDQLTLCRQKLGRSSHDSSGGDYLPDIPSMEKVSVLGLTSRQQEVSQANTTVISS